MLRGELAFREGDASTARRHYRRAVKLLRDGKRDAEESNALAQLARVHLATGDAKAALAATRRATEIHRKHRLAPIQGMTPAMVWWEHSRALAASGDTRGAREALETAYEFMRKGIAGVSDEGLRRNYLNKIDVHREIVGAWLDGCDAGAARPASAAPRIWPAKPACASRSSGWSTPVCA